MRFLGSNWETYVNHKIFVGAWLRDDKEIDFKKLKGLFTRKSRLLNRLYIGKHLKRYYKDYEMS